MAIKAKMRRKRTDRRKCGGCEACHRLANGEGKAFECFWLKGALRESDRPDRIGELVLRVDEEADTKATMIAYDPGNGPLPERAIEIMGSLAALTFDIIIKTPGEEDQIIEGSTAHEALSLPDPRVTRALTEKE